ncbi:grasp-with-spasm system ATP-grasp peptide maturase [Taibaiella chishuiensis]|uniref:ATP-GRASP peptide maturase of grasp-with-spasm system n=1 Tax=Taibaiella chishuiensis TaxID=1434707 RepID=A0A2P8D123_9BACT|nr:grasp-with-spasm system ATP-grasp peptide maturase [Taibaiella chishuiensis]PSK90866.1 ATP-GRASP peptide maturase of grasp-with-spasm system [Taibaiella chishuiensis]
MILILSDCTDVSTDYAIEWFRYCRLPFIRLNDIDLINTVVSVEFKEGKQNIIFNLKEQIVSLDEITAVWFRRGILGFQSNFKNMSAHSQELTDQVVELINLENKTLTDFVIAKLAQKQVLNNQNSYNINKLQTLAFAQELGINIPVTAIETNRKAVDAALKRPGEQIITKPIQDIFWLNYNGRTEAQYTARLSDYEDRPENFYYSLFQECIDKKYELRIFFINNDFYCAAIFSESTDGRHDSFKEKLPRIIPYQISDKLKTQLAGLAKRCEINCGSIDMIIDKSGKHYFLEINPVGQYGMLSKHCNYNLHEKIAHYFTHEKEII